MIVNGAVADTEALRDQPGRQPRAGEPHNFYLTDREMRTAAGTPLIAVAPLVVALFVAAVLPVTLRLAPCRMHARAGPFDECS